MGKNIIIFGATGNAGGQVLDQLLANEQVLKVTTVSRKKSVIENEKLTEIIHSDFLDFSAIENKLEKQDICFYCLGVSQLQVSEEKAYKKITHDFTIAAAEMLLKNNPDLTFCFLSGEGADPSMKSKTLFARIKGETENSLSDLPFKQLYIFRPGYIHPVNLRRKKNTMEKIAGLFYPLMKVISSRMATTSANLAKAMIYVGLNSYDKQLLLNNDINKIYQ